VPPPISARQASRFLVQASMGATREHVARVQEIGYSSWLDEQFALPREQSRWDYLMAAGYNADTFRNGTAGFDAAMWKKLIASSDTLRQRVTLALSEILVTGIDGLVGAPWRQFSAAAYADMLEERAFGNYRSLLLTASRFPAMGQYLTFRGNAKANATTGSQPDENYARELMQLFTIGLVQLESDGSVRLVNGAPVETYGQDDISGLARVFTGWEFDTSTAATSVSPQQFLRVPLVQVASRYETGAKSFLGTTIPAGTDAVTALTRAVDTIFAHPNVGPFVSRQLIQRLVTSNPRPAYVSRVAAAFANDGTGVRGDMKAVLKAILLDPRRATTASPQARAGASCASRCCASSPGPGRTGRRRRAMPGRSARRRIRQRASARAQVEARASSTFSVQAMCRRTAASRRGPWSRPSSRSPTSPRSSATSTSCSAWSRPASATSRPATPRSLRSPRMPRRCSTRSTSCSRQEACRRPRSRC
jgi:uncharacterized protein (DUF1800 family)